MRNRILLIVLCIAVAVCMCACHAYEGSSTFSILFVDVGQGDAALIECDGQYMLIDGGPKSAENKLYQMLEERRLQHLNILAVSHYHEDHIGGLVKALSYASKIDKVIANADYYETETFKEFERGIRINGSKITVPQIGDKFKLGSSEVEVIDTSSKGNGSMVFLVTYGKTRFLFTGDIEYDAQTRISDKYENEKDEPYKIDLLKMPHHGADAYSLYRFIRSFQPTYAVISVGLKNAYSHPNEGTLSKLEQANVKVYRTDLNGDIIVKSDGENISIETSK